MTPIATDKPETGAAKSGARHQPLAERRVVLRVRDLKKAFGGQVVLEGVSADLREGEVVLLRGDNGSGKTTLLNILSGNLEPDAGSIHLEANGATEHFEFPRRWWQDLNPFDHFTPERVAREGVGRTWQDVRLFSTMSLADNIAVATPSQSGENPFKALFVRGSTRREELGNLQRASDYLGGLGLPSRELSSADRISLGQTKRVAIARAVQAGARILFLDEPLAGLDAPGITNVLELLRELVQEHRVTLVIVEHVFNVQHILELADNVWTLQNAKIKSESALVFRQQEGGAATNDLLNRLARHHRHESAINKERLLGGAALWRLQHQKGVASDNKPSLLQVRDLVVHRGKRLVIGDRTHNGAIQGLSFILAENETVILEAPNGWGKTTLAEAILGLIPCSSGEIHLRGMRIDLLPTWERVKLGLSYLRATEVLFPNLTSRESSMLSQRSAQSTAQPIVAPSRAVGALSGGERQKLALSLLPPASLSILDEPFSALDQTNVETLCQELAQQQRSALVLCPSALACNHNP